VAWIRATAMRTEPTMFSGKDPVNPAAGVAAAAELWRKAGITSPIDEIDVAEIYVPFSWYEPMWLENLGFAAPGEGWRLTEAGETEIGGRLPVNPSGGVLSSNPIGASGLLRFAESALQVMGKAGAHQVPGARTALGHAYGGGSQYFSMWVVSSSSGITQTLPAHDGLSGKCPQQTGIHRDNVNHPDDRVSQRPTRRRRRGPGRMRLRQERQHVGWRASERDRSDDDRGRTADQHGRPRRRQRH